jgi:uncharacterized protein YndB with AHSA1/START domain
MRTNVQARRGLDGQYRANDLERKENEMASIRKERTIEATPEAVWEALSDWGALHVRLVPGFVVDTRLDGADRIVTFFNDAVARERLVNLDHDDRRLVWSIVDGPYSHHNGAAQVLADDDGTTRFVWTADLLPDEAAEGTATMMEQGIETAKRTLEASGSRR